MVAALCLLASSLTACASTGHGATASTPSRPALGHTGHHKVSPGGPGGPGGATGSAGGAGARWVASLERKDRGAPGFLQPGSDPSVLPGPILIADRDNHRLLLISPQGQVLWQYPGPGSPPLQPGQAFVSPDDAFFAPTGGRIIVTQEDAFVLTELTAPTGVVTWQYGHPGVPGATPGYLDNPDDAMVLPNGDVLTADIKNCRILVIPPGGQAPSQVIGETTQACLHDPPARFGSPNGVFPLTDGNYLVTEINGDWVDELSLAGQVLWSAQPPGFSYPSDTNEVSPGVYLSVDYTNPGAVETFDQHGQLLWQFAPTGPTALDQPSIALPLPNGDVLMTDDWNHRVIVVDPHTDRIVWQYGHTGTPGAGPGYLDKPDGVDLAPPFSLLVRHRATMGLPPVVPPGGAGP